MPTPSNILGPILSAVANSNVLGPISIPLEMTTDSYVAGFFRDNGRNQYSVETELWVTPGQRRRPHGRRVR